MHLSQHWNNICYSIKKHSVCLLTTPNESVRYTYSCLAQIRLLLQGTKNQSPFKVPVTSIPTETKHFIHLHGKVYLLGAKKRTLSCWAHPLAWVQLHLKSHSKRQTMHHSWLPSPATSIQLTLKITWSDGSGYLQPDLAYRSALWSSTATRRRWVNTGWGTGQHNHPF